MKFQLIAMFLFLVATIGFSCSDASELPSLEDEEKYSSVKIYFVNWDIITRVVLSPEDVRRMRHFYIEINNDSMVSEVVNAIYKESFHDRSSTLPEPARLVVDFEKKDGTVDTVYANKSHILNKDSTKFKLMTNNLINILTNILKIRK